MHYVDADGAQIRMQRAVDAGFGGVALFALGYEDDAVWRAVDTIAAQLARPRRRRPRRPPRHRERPTPRRARMTG